MPVSWTAEKHERLLFILFDHIKFDHKLVANEYCKRYGQDGQNTLTAGAIEQHISKLKRKRGEGKAGGAVAKTTPRKILSTPKRNAGPKTAIPKTPTSSAKRKRTTMSEDDDTEPEMTKANLFEDVVRRGSLSRRSKSVTHRYQDPGSSEEDGDDEADTGATTTATATNLANDDVDENIFDGMINFDGAAEAKPDQLPIHLADGFSAPNGSFALPSRGSSRKSATPAGKRTKMVDLDDESDVSDFAASFN